MTQPPRSAEPDTSSPRLLRGLEELLRRRPGEGGPGSEQSLRAASREAGAWLQRVARARELLGRLGAHEADRLALAGQWLLLEVRPRGLRSVAAQRVRFRLGGQVLGTAPVEPDGVARLAVRAPTEPGMRPLVHDVLGPGGLVVQAGDGSAQAVLQVVGPGEPVLLAEASWALEHPDAPRLLRRLVEGGVRVAYLGLGAAGVRAALRARRAAGTLPEGALISARRSGDERSTLQQALEATFGMLVVRRLRASGVAVVAVVTTEPARLAGVEQAGAVLWTPAQLADRLAEGGAGGLLARAARFQAERTARDETAHRLAAMTGAEPCAAREALPALDNAEARRQVLEAIDGARRRVHLQTYIVEDGRVADELAAALVRAARRGARVRLLVDALYARHHLGPLRNPVLTALEREPGIEVRAVDPPFEGEEVDPLRFKARDHRKLLVVDGEVAFVGGRNVGDPYYVGFEEVAVADFTPHERVPWLDAHVRLRGGVVEHVERAFLEGWRRAGGHLALEGEGRDGAERPEAGPPGGMAAWFVAHDGLGDARALGAYEALFDGAREEILVVNDFPIVDALEAAARRALARGVRVLFLTGSAVARRGDGSFLRGPLYRELFEYLTKHRFEALVRAGADVREAVWRSERVVCRGGAVRPYVHAKLVVADGRWVSVGSANLDATASYWEREAVVVLDAPSLADQVREALAPWLHAAHRLRLDDPQWKREAPLRRLAATFWPETLYS